MFVNWFIKSAHKFPQRPSVEVNNVQMTYQEIGLLSSKIAQAIQKLKIKNSPVGLLAYRSYHSIHYICQGRGIHACSHGRSIFY